jgi:transcriptional regulator with XRE-family HTH domain
MAQVITPNQIVAYNLFQARKLRGWKQTEASEHLEPHLGVRWSKATYSAAERSFERQDRVREFTADEIMAFARAFRVPILWFFLPPDQPADSRSSFVTGHNPLDYSQFLRLLFGDAEEQQTLKERLTTVMEEVPAEEYARDFSALLREVMQSMSREKINKLVQSLDDVAMVARVQQSRQRLQADIRELELTEEEIRTEAKSGRKEDEDDLEFFQRWRETLEKVDRAYAGIARVHGGAATGLPPGEEQ